MAKKEIMKSKIHKYIDLRQDLMSKIIIIIAGFLTLNGLVYGQNFNPVNATDVAYSPPNGSVAIGPGTPSYKLHVTDDDSNPGNVAGYFDYTASSFAGGAFVGIRGGASSTGISSSNMGVLGIGTGASGSNAGSITYGVFGQGSGGGNNYGGYFSGSGSGASGGNNVGVCGILINGAAGAGILNAGVYGDDGGNGGTTLAGYFNGNVTINGGGTINTAWIISDRRFKKDITKLTDATTKIQKLNGYTFNFRVDEFKEKRFDNRSQIGFIAQEIQEVFPELVTQDEKGYYAVNYQGVIPVLVEAFKAQQIQLDSQNKTIESLLENSKNISGIQQNNLSNSGYILDQNIPNPYTNETLIKYTLPEQTNAAYLAIYDLSGKQITTFQLEKGSLSITITSEKLAAGIYIYSIIADGKILDSKRMVVADK